MRIAISLKKPPELRYHKATVSTYFGLRKRVYCYIETPARWVRAFHYPVEFADEELSKILTARVNFYLAILKIPNVV
jgi:hypothetical protein